MTRLIAALLRAEARAAVDRAATRDAILKWGEQVAQRLHAEAEVRRLVRQVELLQLDVDIATAYAEGLEREMADLLPGGES